MTHQDIVKRLRGANLCDLSRKSGVTLRTLRRIKNGHSVPLATTIDKITPHLAKKEKANG